MTAPLFEDADLRARLGLETYIALFDRVNAFDRGTGTATTEMTEGVNSVLRGATARTYAWLPINYKIVPPPDPVPELLVELGLMYGEALAWKRNPDYLNAMKMGPSVENMLKLADQMGARIQSAILQMPDNAEVPANVGGIIVDDGMKFMITDKDGNNNGAGF